VLSHAFRLGKQLKHVGKKESCRRNKTSLKLAKKQVISQYMPLELLTFKTT